MKEIRDIITAYQAAQKTGIQTALATVVHVYGSSYRRAGAHMLITEDGKLTGAISGGCLEGDALRKARLAMAQQRPMLVMYDTNDEDDEKLGIQLGCNGVIHILIEPILAERPDNPINLYGQIINKRKAAVVVTIFNMASKFETQFGTCILLDEDDRSFGSLPDDIKPEILNDARKVLHSRTAEIKNYSYQQDYTCFFDLILPDIALIVAGAGNDAVPLVKMAKLLGWTVNIADGRPAYNTPERFPEADHQIIAKAEEVIKQLNPDNRTVFMLMTHNYNYDMGLLKTILPLNLPYIGVLGPKKRLVRMLEEIGGPELALNQPGHINGPAGLDIGSENPEQIALSILAEIQSVLSRRNGTPLKNLSLIHDRKSEKNIISHLPE